MRLIVTSFFLAATFAVFAADDSKSVALSDTPSAVQKIINAQLGGGKLGGITQSKEDGETVFDVGLTDVSGNNRDFSVADDGTLLSYEVTLTEVPAAVQQTMHAQASGWELESIDKNVDDTEITYDVDVSKDGREKTFTVADDGDLLSEEVTLTETPAAVQKSIQAQIAGGQVKSVDETFDEDGTGFDVTATAKDGGEKSFCVDTNGTLFSEEVSLEKMRPGVRRAITETIGDGKVLRIDKSLGGKRASYEVQGRKDGKPFDFSVSARGKFMGMDD